MKLNQKLYPKAMILRKWMIVVAGIAIATILLSFMYNLSHQKQTKQEDKVAAAQSDKPKTLANSEDMAWIWPSSISRQTIPAASSPSPPSTKPENKPAVTPLTGEGLGDDPLGRESQNIPDNTHDEEAQKRLEEKQKAMMMPITANQLTASTSESGRSGIPGSVNRMSAPSGNVGLSTDDANGQAQKEAFVNKAKNDDEDVYLNKDLIAPRSPYELQAGSIIPGILISGINSDLPGQLVGQIRENVFDSITGDHVLIPQGAKVVGLYDSKVTYGQERVLVVWKRIIYPNGKSIDLSGMPGVDLSGYAGFTDQVNNHFGKIFGSVLLLSTMSAGAQLSQPNNNNNDNYNNYPTVGQTMAQSLGTNISDFGTQLANKNLNIQPTLVIRPGYLFNISVTKDIIFPGPYGEG
jgi:type IV secretion system protein VirB10